MREMKDSEVEWIGEIPRDWRIAKFKFFFSIIGGCGFKEEYQGASQGDYPFLKASDINGSDRTVSSAKNYVNQDLVQQERYSIVPAYSIIIAKIGEALKKNHRKINTCDCIIDNNCEAFSLISSADSDLSYLYYVLSQIDMVWFDNGGTVPSINNEKLRDFFLPNPNNATQHRIADYLDAKCTQIDRAIARQQEVIEKLKAYKLSVITEAVTKGLNPDVPMKDSGIEWIGEIPEHWEVSALKNYIDVLPGYAFSSLDFDTENGIPLLRGVNVTPNGLRWDDVVYWNKSISDELEPFALCKNDIVFGLDRPWINEGTRITIISENDLPCLLLQRVCRIRGAGDLDFRIVYYWLGSSMFQDIVSLATTGVSVPHISTRQIGNFFIAVPPEAEQKHICEYLDSRCSKINAIVIQKNEIISKLTEYKKSLIYEVVTGKREV